MYRRSLIRTAVAVAAGAVVVFVAVPADSVNQDAVDNGEVEVEALVPQPNAATASCGVERWSVKTGTDADRSSITLQSTTPTTVASLRALPAPSSLPANNRIAPTEDTVFQLHSTLTKFKLE